MVKNIFISRGSGLGFKGDGSEKSFLFKVTSGQDAPPALPAPSPPACSRHEQTGLSERQRSAGARGSHAGLANIGLPLVGIALTLHSVVMQLMKLTGMQACSCSSRNARVNNAHTHIHTHAQAHTNTQAHTHTEKHMHRHTHPLAPLHTRTHIHMHTLWL